MENAGKARKAQRNAIQWLTQWVRSQERRNDCGGMGKPRSRRRSFLNLTEAVTLFVCFGFQGSARKGL